MRALLLKVINILAISTRFIARRKGRSVAYAPKPRSRHSCSVLSKINKQLARLANHAYYANRVVSRKPRHFEKMPITGLVELRICWERELAEFAEYL
jgi:hypothetical protein